MEQALPVQIVALSGVAGSGKDETAKRLCGSHGFFRVSFADAIREDLYSIMPDVAEAVDIVGWDHLKRDNQDIRVLLQNYGKRCRDVWGEDCWIDRAHAKIVASGCAKIVITDVRYHNEVDFVRRFIHSFWYLERPGFSEVNDHESESHYGYLRSIADELIVNAGSLHELQVTASEVYKETDFHDRLKAN
jgi:hypothetical protein